MTGVPSEPDCLRRAGVHRATCVVAVDEDDVANAALLQQVRALADSTRQSPLACAVHIGDLQLRRQLRSREIARAGRIRLQFINIFDDAAVRLLRTHPLFNDICLRADRDPHLLVVGHGGMLEALVYHSADGWRERAVGGNARLRITIVDPRASSVVELWHRRHAGLSSLCDLRPVDVEFPSAEFEQLPSVTDATTMVVRLDTAARTLSAALSLHRQGRGRRVPVIACPDHEAGLASLLRLDADFELFAELHMFGVYDQGLDPDLLPGRTIERLAQLLHQDYVASQCDAGRTPADNPALAPWDELSEELRESNRLEAEFIGLRLSAAGYGIEPLTGFSGAAVEFTEEEIDLMARLEHRRWMAERLLEGWRPGPERDDERKVNPNLRPWDELTPEMKEYNLQSTRALPALLARAGLQVYREESGVSPA